MFSDTEIMWYKWVLWVVTQYIKNKITFVAQSCLCTIALKIGSQASTATYSGVASIGTGRALARPLIR